MRKKYKRKKTSCGLCKPNKVGWEHRETHRDKKQRLSADAMVDGL